MEPWTEEITIKYLKKLEVLPCLWNRNNRNFKNPSSRVSALYKLARHMNIPGYGAQMMQRKMLEIKAVFMKEKRRINENRNAENEFKRKCKWYKLADNLWRKIRLVPKCSCNSDAGNSNPGPSEDSTARRTPGPNENCAPIRRRGSDEVSTPMRTTKTDGAFKMFVYETMNVGNQISALSSGNEFDSFGQSVACQLKNMKPKGAYQLQEEIQSLITKKKIKDLPPSSSRYLAEEDLPDGPSIRMENDYLFESNIGNWTLLVKIE